MKNDIYVEYSNHNFEYVSFTKAKKLIAIHKPKQLSFNCVDEEKSVAFLNILLNSYKIIDNILEIK
jgi:hypothetical protein